MIAGPFTIAQSSVQIRIPYTMGTHEAFSENVTGGVNIDKDGKARGTFVLPINAIDNKSSKRDCHMKEGLGLDYSKSRFPGEHVCNDDNQLPATGPDAIVYPNIEYVVKSFKEEKGNVTVQGVWKIHGSEKEAELQGDLTKDNAGREVFDATFPLSLSDFGITIKKAFIVSVKDRIAVKLHLVFNKGSDKLP